MVASRLRLSLYCNAIYTQFYQEANFGLETLRVISTRVATNTQHQREVHEIETQVLDLIPNSIDFVAAKKSLE